MLNIGNLQLKSGLILAPLSGITDLSFRLINRRFGCGLAFVEMINVRALGYKSRKTHQMLSTVSEDRPLGVQLLGNDPKFLLRALDILQKYKFDILDFNAACPEKKVTKRGEGAGLLREPKKLQRLLKIMVKNSALPVTIKIRAGWDNNSVNAQEVALLAQDAGVNAVFIHGRTKAQEYKGDVDYQTIREVKQAIKIPVIASGNILSGPLAKKMLDDTGCDGLLVARGSLGNPWIFQEITHFLNHGMCPQRRDANEVTQAMIAHLNLCLQVHGEKIGVMLFRKFFSWYTKGFDAVRVLREKANYAKTKESMLAIITSFHLVGG